MKINLILILILGLTINCFSQEPQLNYEQVLKESNQKLQSLSTLFYRTEDTTNAESSLLYQIEFNLDGKIIKKYLYTFWDVVSYDHTTTYEYDLNGNLIEKTKIQKILNLGERDQSYISALGDEPINEKSYFSYDKFGRLTKEVNYFFKTDEFEKNKDPLNIVEYYYNKKGLLVKEIGTTPNGLIIYLNHETTYQYDNKGNKIKESKYFSKAPTKYTQTKTYLYNKDGLLTKQIEKDPQISMNNKQYRYLYNEQNQKITTLKFSEKEQQWLEIETFSYDNDGNLILEVKNTIFEYDNNGLIHRELWKSSSGKTIINLYTTYTFFE